MSCHWGRARKNLRVQYPKPPFLGSRGLAPRCSCRVQSETGRVNLQEGHPPAAPHLPGAGRKVEMQGFLPSRALGRQGWGDRVVVASSSPVPGRAGLPATADRGQLSHGPGAPGFGVRGGWEEVLPSENTPPAPPQASGATFTEVALRVGEGGTPAPPPSHQSCLSGHRPLLRVDTALGRVARPLSRSGPHASGMSPDISGVWGPISKVDSHLEWDRCLCQFTPTPGGWRTQTQAAASVWPRAALFACDHTAWAGAPPRAPDVGIAPRQRWAGPKFRPRVCKLNAGSTLEEIWDFPATRSCR